MWKELDRLKRFRESEANKRVHRCVTQLASATAELDDCEQRLDTYRRHAEQQEQTLYQGLFSRPFSQRDLNELHDALAELRRGERQLEQARDGAARAVEAAEHALAQAREAHVLAQRACEKFSELMVAYDEEVVAAAQLAEDAEMEECAAVRRVEAESAVEEIES